MSGPAYIDSFRLIRILPDDVIIAADAVDDTLTLVAGPGISLVANTNADQLTIVNTNPAEFSLGIAGDDSSIKTISSGETIRFAGAQNVTVTADSEGAITITGPDLSNQSNWDEAYSWGDHAVAGYLTSAGTIGNDVTIGSIRINTNVITTVDSNANLELRANGSGKVTIDSVKISLGRDAGATTQGSQAVAVGNQAGQISQGNTAVAIGSEAGKSSQGAQAVAIGYQTASVSQGGNAIAIGQNTGLTNQGIHAVAIGTDAGKTLQGNYAVAIGHGAGNTNQTTGSIAINAGNSLLNTVGAGFHVNPIRAGDVGSLLKYNTTTKEITHTSDDILVGSISIENNTIQTVDSNANLELRANGTGAVFVESISVNGTTIDSADSSAITVTPDVVFEAGVTVGNHIIPSSNENIDLGSNTNRFRDLYLSGSTIQLGNASISSIGNSIELPSNTTFGGSTISSIVTSTSIDLGNVTNESKATMFTSPTFTGTVSGVTATHVGLGNVTNESKATMFASPTFTGTVAGVTATHVGLGNVNNTSDSNKPVSTDQLTALNLKAPLADPTFTGTVAGVTATHVGLGNVTNESKATMFASPTFTGTVTIPAGASISGYATLANPTFTGTVSGVTATHVGLGNVTNESKATMFASPTFTGTVAGVTATHVGLGNVTNESKATMFTSPTFVTPALGTPASGTLTNCTFPTLNQNTAGSAATFTSTTQNSQFNSIGVGTAASTTAGEIRATNDVTAFYSSDFRLKENIQTIDRALEKLRKVRGVMFDWKDEVIERRGGEDGYFVRKHDTGVIAQEIEQILPEIVAVRPDGYKAVQYEKLAGIMIQAINELADQVEEIKHGLK